MKNSAIILFLILFSLTAFAQKPKSSKNPAKTKLAKTTPANAAGGKEAFEKAVNLTNAAERIAALQKFVGGFPKSDEKTHALELIVSGRAEIADEKLRLGDTQSGVKLFKLAIKDAPMPVSDKLFTKVILQVPTNLFLRGERGAALEAAKMIEAKIDGNANQLLGLATFYLGTENAAEARRLAEKAILIEPNLPAAYQTLGLAKRLDFQLEDAANAYAKALELDADSIVSKRSLAEMKRAVGKPTEAVELYREILTKDETDAAAQTGLILALFDAEKRSEAEQEMAKSLEQNPNNLFLLVGAAYWYAAHEYGAKAVELANKAVAVEPRYTWAHIALARGLMQEKRPLEAERTLLAARQYGNFPTLNYELASARLAAGFYREAANELKKTFAVKDDLIITRLGGRVPKQAQSFTELLAMERQASIFEPMAADSPASAEKLKSLLNFSQQIDSANLNETAISNAADDFVKGDDNMKLHRQLYAVNRLLEKRTAVAKALELTKAAVGGVDAALNVATPAAAVLADELYDSRTIAISRNEFVIVPDIPRQTLSGILRGRIETLTGRALQQQEKPAEAVTRFKRALSVLPEKSAWWRDSMWQLGAALQSEGKPTESLDAYVKSYMSGAPDVGKRIIIESLYQQINGNLEGLDEKIGAKPLPTIAALPIEEEKSQTVAQAIATPAAQTAPILETTPEIKPMPQAGESALPIAEAKPTPEVLSSQIAKTLPKAEKIIENPVKIETAPTPETTPTPEVQPSFETTPKPTPEITPTAELITAPTPAAKTETAPEVLPTPEIKTVTEPKLKKPKTIKNQPSADNPDKTQKLIFEPIIITVPKTEAVITPKTEEKIIETAVNENPVSQIKSDETAAVAKADNKKTTLNKTRSRIVAENKPEEVSQCKILTSEEAVSILNSGGSLGVLVGFEDGRSVNEITAFSDSPKDLEIRFEPEIGGLSGRAFFVIKSVSATKGEFTVTFESTCGKKEVLVKVR
ncbi:MAG: hypothetical protein H0W58_13185 [Acidobacteria bacterium]|nr:hypothetical protein [Acidobacteriota bacterium]